MSGYVYVDSSKLEQTWKNVKNGWQHSLHNMCSRTGSFPPSLARYFIEGFSEKGQKILDPFSGKGTAPLEACLCGRIGIGNDASPEAYILTHAKVKSVSLKQVRNYIQKVKQEAYPTENVKSVNKNIRIFFHPKTLAQIIAIREIVQHDESDEGIFLKALMCGIIHGASENSLSLPCSHSFSMSPRYVTRYAKERNLVRPVRDVIHCLETKAESVLVDGLPEVSGEAYMKNATSLPLENETIDLIITSPPYFNKQTYAWDNWLRLWFLGYDYKMVQKQLFQSGSLEKFLNFMSESLKEMYRVLKKGSSCFIIVGDVTLGKKTVVTAELLAKSAQSIGFKVIRIINDPIPKEKKYFMFIPADKGVRMDRILELAKG
ncbi:MAG: DNA methyltransferase [Candidatus Bathyarchaeia archaeon]